MTSARKVVIRRAKAPADTDFIISCFDGALPHLAAIGCEDQYGTLPISDKERFRERIRRYVEGDEDTENTQSWIADIEMGDVMVAAGAISWSNTPDPDAPPPSRPFAKEQYGLCLVINWRLGDESKGIGSMLLRFFEAQARSRGVQLLRADCWRGADDRLAKYYNSQGYRPTIPFEIPDIYRPGRIRQKWLLEKWIEKDTENHIISARL